MHGVDECLAMRLLPLLQSLTSKVTCKLRHAGVDMHSQSKRREIVLDRLGIITVVFVMPLIVRLFCVSCVSFAFVGYRGGFEPHELCVTPRPAA